MLGESEKSPRARQHTFCIKILFFAILRDEEKKRFCFVVPLPALFADKIGDLCFFSKPQISLVQVQIGLCGVSEGWIIVN